MNKNQIITENWSNLESKQQYLDNWPDEPKIAEQHENGIQCGGCAFFAPFNADFGLCCNLKSRHHLETVFEHFACSVCEGDDWGNHTFREAD